VIDTFFNVGDLRGRKSRRRSSEIKAHTLGVDFPYLKEADRRQMIDGEGK